MEQEHQETHLLTSYLLGGDSKHLSSFMIIYSVEVALTVHS
jgi:hypothetical protein